MRVFQAMDSRLSIAAHRGRPSKKEREMKLITRHELAGLSICELRGLLRQTFNALAGSAPESPQRSAALASLENIQAELGARLDGQ
jgi:butyrate kinase